LRGAAAAVGAEPENVTFLYTLGLAQYRNGRYGEALLTLTRCDQLRHDKGLKNVPHDVAVVAMALVRLGRIEEAEATFDRLEEIMRDHEEEWIADEVARPLFDECSLLLEDEGTLTGTWGNDAVDE
jgi:hypothetical protein